MKPLYSKILAGLFCLLFWAEKTAAAPPVWIINTNSFSKSMTAVLRVKLDGEFLNLSTTLVAAHVGGVLRSNGTSPSFPPFNPMGAYFYSTISSNQSSGETVGFWVYVAATDKIHPATQTFTFVHQSSQGSQSSPFILDIQTAVFLPIELAEFSAKTIEKGQKTQLDWRTANETNNAGFDIERSSDGAAFEKIGFVEGQNRAATYRFLDEKPLAGRSFYRLRQVDFDGAASFSPVRSVEILDRKRLALEAEAGGFWLFSDSEEVVRLRLFDLAGRLIFEKKADATTFFSLDDGQSGAFFIAAERADGASATAVFGKI